MEQLSKGGQYYAAKELFMLYNRKWGLIKTMRKMKRQGYNYTHWIEPIEKTLEEIKPRISNLENLLCDCISMQEINEHIYN